jgi:hypothetical protein
MTPLIGIMLLVDMLQQPFSSKLQNFYPLVIMLRLRYHKKIHGFI